MRQPRMISERDLLLRKTKAELVDMVLAARRTHHQLLAAVRAKMVRCRRMAAELKEVIDDL